MTKILQAISSQRRAKILIFIGLFTGTLVLVIMFLDSKMVSTVDLSQLSFEDVQLPNQWDCSWCTEKISTNWEYEEKSALDYKRDNPPILTSENFWTDAKVVHWIDKNYGYVIELIVVDYRHPISARINFNLNDPKGRLQKVYWNFSYASENIQPANWDWKNEDADEEAVRCGDGTQEQCTGWFYQARYGQYYLLIHFYQDLDYQVFRSIVQAINREFVSNLR